MRAELSAALCSPKDNPFGLNVDATKVALGLDGTPNVTVPPFAVDLPTLTVTPLTLTVTPPTITVTPPNLIVALPTVGVTMTAGLIGFPPVPTTTIVVTPTTPLIVTTTPLTVRATPLTVTTTPVTVTLGSIRVHAAPVTGTELPLAVGLDLDDTKAEVSFDGLRAALQGCLTLNGGEPPTPHTPPVTPPPPTATSAVPRALDGTTRVEIKGQGFGQTQGRGFVEVTDQGATSSRPTIYDAWADTQIVVRFRPALAAGAHAAIVTNDAGGRSGPALFTV